MKPIFFYFVGFAGLFLFIKGFFPIKTNKLGYANKDDAPSELNNLSVSKYSNVTKEKPGKLVWIVIDAMRLDFITDENHQKETPFINKVLKSNQAKVYKAIAKAPTVTMPRIKALTSGSITGFIDILLNMNKSQRFTLDNIVYQLKEAGKRLIFYGDDTWLKLFPGSFQRHDGTTSFFVNDYTEVDVNVSRHISPEMKSDDWDVMILHFLGLDHIGHLSGPHSPLVKPKLAEMDGVIQNICSSFLDKENNIVVLTSDHGMSGSGSHGGTSDSEVNTPLVIIRSEKEKRFEPSKLETVEQIDISPSIALYMNVPVPRSSMGKTIIGFIENMDKPAQLSALQYNTFQLVQHIKVSGKNEHIQLASSCYTFVFCCLSDSCNFKQLFCIILI